MKTNSFFCPQGIMCSPRTAEREVFGAPFCNTILGAIFLAMLGRILVSHPLDINLDCALYLHCGQMLLEGKLPYVDFVDSNPPLVMYLSVIPAALANLFSLHVVTTFSLVVLILTVWSSLTIKNVLISISSQSDKGQVRILVIVLTLISMMFMLRVFRWQPFGQREHLFILLWLPFCVIRWLRWEGEKIATSTAISTGIAAAIGVCVKPHFVAISLLVEIYWVINKRNVRRLVSTEMVFFVLFGLLYAIHFLFLPGVVKQELFGRWLPFIADRYAAVGAPFSDIFALGRNSFFFFVLASIPLSYLVPASDRGIGLARLTRSLGVLVLGCTVSFIIQGKYFNYHLVPAIYGSLLVLVLSIMTQWRCFVRNENLNWIRRTSWLTVQALVILLLAVPFLAKAGGHIPGQGSLVLFTLLLFLLICLHSSRFHKLYAAIERFNSDGLSKTFQLVVVALVGISALVFGLYPFERTDPLQDNPIAEVIRKYTKDEDPVLIIGTPVDSVYPMLVQMNRRPGSRFIVSWAIPLFYMGVTPDADGSFPYRLEEEAPEEEVRFLEELAEDIAENEPDLILIHDSRAIWVKGFMLKEYLAKTSFLTRAMHKYTQLPSVSDYDVYVLR